VGRAARSARPGAYNDFKGYGETLDKERFMATTTVTHDQDAIVSEIQIAAPPERVFRALSDAGQLKVWFGSPDCPVKSWNMDARLGGRYSYATERGKIAINGVDDFLCHGEIVEYDPPRVLAYTWIANWHDDPSRSTLVRWELTPKLGGTRVKVTHSGLSTLPVARKDYSGGWPEVVEMLKKHVEQ
jgi:uncharacterized protein YndB with AHSA1/START domain